MMSEKTNPYTLSFGKQPPQMVSRFFETQDIIDAFKSDPPANQVYILTGVRGSGKTVTMTEIAKEMDRDKDWIIVNLTAEYDLVESLAAELGEKKELKQFFKIEGLSVSLPGITIDVKNVSPITDAKVAVSKMLRIIRKKGKKVLVTLDEASNNESVKKFAAVFQILLREELPIYLIMTGLYENIRSLQDEKSLTFLYRAPRIELPPLSMRGIAENYQKTFSLDTKKADEMAALTKGYPYAFQLLGYLTWRAGGDYGSVITEYRRYLEDYVYDKIYSEMSEKDRKVALGIAHSSTGGVEEIKNILNMKQNEWNPYRKRLLDKGIIIIPERGKVSFTLPYFAEFLMENYQE